VMPTPAIRPARSAVTLIRRIAKFALKTELMHPYTDQS
jgi:hypothetical protein